ncbi:helix-turn-helix domain-containing protein [Agromyces sp. SYSU K20354]|uniref:ArsR/SmtB family transcription factor n=1 Tax=Agromyces cavernae TaxID=2898659 RepID=UPI001E2E1F96|nr:DUF5937 family protein [Agromyces cavernae]MCD2443024.1 helix-turn-helix domain-containing protein [Agromyces cavernae]
MDRNFVDFRLAPDDISAIRFGVSPGHELCHAVRVLQRPAEHPLQWGWLRGVRDRVPREAFDLLAVVIGAEGYFPDFFTATPSWDMTPGDEAERLRSVPADLVRADLAKMILRSTGARQAAITRLREQPERARELIADAWEEAWAALLAPVWVQLERILRADIAVRSRRAATEGLAGMVTTLHPTVAWNGDAVRVGMRLHSEVLDCRGSGLVLVPSVFGGQRCAVLTEPPAQPTLFYPALGVTETWARDPEEAERALGALLGPARAGILLAAHEPRTTSQVAADAGLATSTASHHLTVLRDAGLVASTRRGASVLHLRTPLGEAIVGAVL